MRTCSVDDCERPHRTRGFCNMHHQRWLTYGTTDLPPRRMTAEQLIHARGWTVTESGCWEWGGTIRKDGYGEVAIDRRRWLAHRAVFEHYRGPIPAGLVVRHKCDNPPCVNPDHLELGTQKQNIRDMVARNRHQWVGRTECRKGHDLTAPGATREIITSAGDPARLCTTCLLERGRRATANYKARKKAA